MRKIILAIVLVIAFSCKNEKKEVVKPTEKKEVLTKIDIPDYITWGKILIDLDSTSLMYKTNKAFKMARLTNTKPSYFVSRSIISEYDSDYIASIIVKKGEKSSFFGFRISGPYPDRADAVFDLEKGIVVGVKKFRDFENESAKIESLGDDWYKCTIKTTVLADKINLIFGPTNEKTKIEGWESSTNEFCDIYVIPQSLSLEKVLVQ